MKSPVFGSTPSGSYSPGIIAKGRFVFVSGQGPLTDGVIVEGGIEPQTRLTLENVATVLAGAGASMADVVRCGVYLQNADDFDAMDRVYCEYFPAPLPARTTIGAALQGILIEIDCIAVLPEPDL